MSVMSRSLQRHVSLHPNEAKHDVGGVEESSYRWGSQVHAMRVENDVR